MLGRIEANSFRDSVYLRSRDAPNDNAVNAGLAPSVHGVYRLALPFTLRRRVPGGARAQGTVVVLCRLNVTPVVAPSVTVTVRVAVCPATSAKPSGTCTATE